MATVTTTQAGDFNTAGNWDGTPDYVNDTLVVNHAMTIAADTAVGADGLAATVQLTIDATSTKTGSITVNSGRWTQSCTSLINNGYMYFAAGTSWRWGGASGTQFHYDMSNAGSMPNSRIEFHGTSGSRCTVDKAAAAGNGRFQRQVNNAAAGSGFIAEYTDFSDLGTSTVAYGGYWIDCCPLAASTTQKLYLSHCNFIRCGGVQLVQCGAGQDVVIEYCYSSADLVALGALPGWFLNTTKATTGLRTFQYNGMPRTAVSFQVSLGGWSIKMNVLQYVLYSSVTEFTVPTLFKGLMTIFLNGASFSKFGLPGDNNTMLTHIIDRDASTDEGGCFCGQSYASQTGTETFDNVIIQNSSTNVGSDGLIPQLPVQGPYTFKATRWLVLQNPSGVTSSGITSNHSSKWTYLDIRHCTQHLNHDSNGIINVNIGAGYIGHAGMIARCEDSIFCAPIPVVAGVARGMSAFGSSDVTTTGLNLRFASTAGSTSTVFNYSAGTWQTTADANMVACAAILKVIAVGTSDMTLGESQTITANTGTTVTVGSAFAGSNFVGATLAVIVMDQVVDGMARNNAYYNADAGPVYPASGLAADVVQRIGATGFYATTPTNINVNSVDLGDGSDWVAGGPQFRNNEAGYDLITFDQDVLGFSAATAWVTATPYVVGDIVSCVNATFFGGRTVNFYCHTAHTSGATTKPGDIAQSWQTRWQLAVGPRMARSIADGTTYSDPTIWYNGDDTSTGRAVNISAIEMYHSRIRTIKMPRSTSLRTAASDGTTIGAVQYVELPTNSGMFFMFAHGL